jgi:hypothetical protein
MEKIDLTGETQYRFKKNCRTETACLEIQSKIGALCDERKHVTMASLDLSAAFDVVNRPLQRMRVFGIPEVIILMIQDWLTVK